MCPVQNLNPSPPLWRALQKFDKFRQRDTNLGVPVLRSNCLTSQSQFEEGFKVKLTTFYVRVFGLRHFLYI
jgi:hypothetical protein